MVDCYFPRNVLSQGGREVFVSATLPGHMDACHSQRTGRGLNYIKPTKISRSGKTDVAPKTEKAADNSTTQDPG